MQTGQDGAVKAVRDCTDGWKAGKGAGCPFSLPNALPGDQGIQATVKRMDLCNQNRSASGAVLPTAPNWSQPLSEASLLQVCRNPRTGAVLTRMKKNEEGPSI